VSGLRAIPIIVISSLLSLPAAGQQPSQGSAPRVPQQPSHSKQSHPAPKLGDWLRQHKNLTPEQQEKALENDPAFKRLSPERQAQYRERLRKFNSLPPQQREHALQQMAIWEKLTPDQRKQVREAHQQLQSLPDTRRAMVHRTLRDLRKMSPQERQQVLQSEKFRNTFSGQEQAILRNLSDINPSPAPEIEGRQ
jgi:Protein of unknown function (DUF3106)